MSVLRASGGAPRPRAPRTLCYTKEHRRLPGAAVPDVLPFPGIRYDCAAAGAELEVLAAPPYDVIDDDLHASLEASHGRNSVRLILPRDAENEGDRYESAAATSK